MNEQAIPDVRTIEEVLGLEGKKDFLRAFAFSFRFSQGNKAQEKHQQRLFQAMKIFRPEWHTIPATKENIREISDFALHMQQKLARSYKHTGDAIDPEDESLLRAKQFFEILHGPVRKISLDQEGFLPYRLIKYLMMATIEEDYYYTVDVRKDEDGYVEEGRPIDAGDQWDSQFVMYILNEQQTGSAVFDEIFAVLGNYLWMGYFQRDKDPRMKKSYEKARAVLEKYNLTHETGDGLVLPDVSFPKTLIRPD